MSFSIKEPEALRTIGEVAKDLDIPTHVLRFWETRFTSLHPIKQSGGRRYYRPEDIRLLQDIRRLLYDQGYTIKGAQKFLKEQPHFPKAKAQELQPSQQDLLKEVIQELNHIHNLFTNV